MIVPTSNVIVGFDREVMSRLFSEGSTYKSLVAEITEDRSLDVLLFDNESNPNFISFEHTFGMRSGMRMTLEFIDPKQEFEKRFFDKLSVGKIISSYTVPEIEKIEGANSESADDVKQSLKEYPDEFLAAFKEELISSAKQKELYVAYGTGNNFDLWSGPHRVTLVGADIDVGGPRKIKIMLAPTPYALDINQRRGAYNESVNLNLQGLGIRYSGESKEINFQADKVYDPTDYLDSFKFSEIKNFNKETIDALKNLGEEQIAKNISKYDFHSMIVDAIRQYVQKATGNSNVIVILPNINVVCRRAISDLGKDFKIEAPSGSPELGPGNLKEAKSKQLYARDLDNLGKSQMFLVSVLKSFGLTVKEKDDGLPVMERPVIPAFPLAYRIIAEQSVNVSEAFLRKLKKKFTVVLTAEAKTIPNHTKILKNVFDKIKERSKDAYQMSNLGIFYETNTDILKLWSTGKNADADEVPWSKAYTLAGYDSFKEEGGAIIVGDVALIKEYLYGGVDLNQKYASIDFLKSEANKSTGITQTTEVVNTEDPTPEDFRFAATTVIPLHPLDRVLLASPIYNAAIRELCYPKLVGDGSFGNISLLPDEFAYKDVNFSETEKGFIEENGISVFRYNTQNPNVLDMSFKYGPIYLAMLKQLGFQKEIKKIASAVVEGILPRGVGSFPITTPGAAMAYWRSKQFSLGKGDTKRQKIITQLANKLSPALVESLGENTAEEAANSIAAMVAELEKNNLKGLVEVDQQLPGTPQSIMTDQVEDLYRRAIGIEITTLPNFHLSRMSTITSPCILFAQDQPIFQNNKVERSLINNFISGYYKIMGFTHRITPRETVSEFKLVKNSFKLSQADNETE